MKPEYKLLDDEWQFWRLDPAELAAAWYHEIKRELTRYQNDIEDYPKCDIDPPWLDLSDDDPLKILKLDLISSILFTKECPEFQSPFEWIFLLYLRKSVRVCCLSSGHPAHSDSNNSCR